MNMSKSKFLSPNCRHTEVCPVHLSGLRQRLSRERIRLQCRWVRSLGQEDPLEKEWQPTPVFLPEKSHGQRSLAGYSPWDCKEWDMTEQLSMQAHLRLEQRNLHNMGKHLFAPQVVGVEAVAVMERAP